MNPFPPMRRSTGFGGICGGAALVQVMAAVLAFTFLGKLRVMYLEMDRPLPAATAWVLQGNGAPVWGVLLVMGMILGWAAARATNRARSIAILAAAVVSGILGIAVPLLVLWPVRGA